MIYPIKYFSRKNAKTSSFPPSGLHSHCRKFFPVPFRPLTGRGTAKRCRHPGGNFPTPISSAIGARNKREITAQEAIKMAHINYINYLFQLVNVFQKILAKNSSLPLAPHQPQWEKSGIKVGNYRQKNSLREFSSLISLSYNIYEIYSSVFRGLSWFEISPPCLSSTGACIFPFRPRGWFRTDNH
jgi:hypothetical protein